MLVEGVPAQALDVEGLVLPPRVHLPLGMMMMRGLGVSLCVRVLETSGHAMSRSNGAHGRGATDVPR